tara:strand:+ start:647 stop:808 length:162 start_codon:yes stop_codon:yes gene_type:complete
MFLFALKKGNITGTNEEHYGTLQILKKNIRPVRFGYVLCGTRRYEGNWLRLVL